MQIEIITTSPNEVLTISPVVRSPGGSINVQWGDGQSNSYGTSGARNHTYVNAGTYTLEISNTLANSLEGFGTPFTVINKAPIRRILSWGNSNNIWNLESAFRGCFNLTEVPATLPSSINTKTFELMFAGANSFNQNISGWNTSDVVNMRSMFEGGSMTFNQPIGSWDVSNVTTMQQMFLNNPSFNQDLNDWDTSSVVNMSEMFFAAFAFNSPIGNWDVSQVTSMTQMFFRARFFNQPIGSWNVGSVTNMASMFSDGITGIHTFNQDISNWNVKNVINMDGMFRYNGSFNRDLSGWCVENIVSQPSNFDIGASAWVLPKPVWGTCPISFNPALLRRRL